MPRVCFSSREELDQTTSLGAAVLPCAFFSGVFVFPKQGHLDLLQLTLFSFVQEGDRRMKLQNMVKFPLSGLDMTPHVVKRSQSSWSLPSHWSPWRRPYGLGRDPEDYIYDLYAVCNHHGTMQGGHYTGKYPAILRVLDPFTKKTVIFLLSAHNFASLWIHHSR